VFSTMPNRHACPFIKLLTGIIRTISGTRFGFASSQGSWDGRCIKSTRIAMFDCSCDPFQALAEDRDFWKHTLDRIWAFS